MGESGGLFVRMMVIGLAVAAPVGAMGVLCIQRTVARGWSGGLSTGSGIATADAMFAAVAALGITAVADALVSLQAPLRIVGGVGLLWLGWRALRSAPPSPEPPGMQAPGMQASDVSHPGAGQSAGSLLAAGPLRDYVSAAGPLRDYVSAVGLTLANPMTIIAFAAIFAGAGLTAQPDAAQALVATAGVAVGSLLWWIALTAVVAAIRHALSDRVLLWVNRISGVMLLVFGALAILSVFVAWRR